MRPEEERDVGQGSPLRPPDMGDFSAVGVVPVVRLGAASRVVFLGGSVLLLLYAGAQTFAQGTLPRPFLVAGLVALVTHTGLFVGFFPPYHLRFGVPGARCSNCWPVAVASIVSMLVVVVASEEGEPRRLAAWALGIGSAIGAVPRALHVFETKRLW